MLPTSTDVKLTVKDAAPPAIAAVVVFVTEAAATPSGGSLLNAEDRTAAERILKAGVVRGKPREIGFDVVEQSGGKFRRVYAVGLGKPEKMTTESIRQAAGAAVRALRKHRLKSAALIVPDDLKHIAADEAAQAVTVGAMLAAFQFNEYKGTARPKDESVLRPPLELTLVASAGSPQVREAVAEGKIIADAQNFARTIASRPGNDITPLTLAKVAQDLAREAGLAVRIIDEKEMASLGMGGILGVGSGSIASPPRLIVFEHGGSSKKSGKASPGRTLLVVGKAITFDTGGISIKPAEKMGKMIFDKCGGMAVLGLMYAVARLKLPIRIIGILSSAENSISEKAYRPGDYLRMYNGVTVEVTNTDAEGRLVLGDALAWGIEQYKPAAVVDLATLTGGVITALGKTMAGVMGNDDTLIAELTAAGEAAGEKMWRLPLGEDQREQIRSEAADIINSAGREGHPLQGAAFLSYFVPADSVVPWAHLDIAGVADTEKEMPYYARGATGWGVRTLVNWARRHASR